MINDTPETTESGLAVFKGYPIRHVLFNNRLYFSVVDVVAALTDTFIPRKYWTDMKRREYKASGIQLAAFCRQLKMLSADGKKRRTDAARVSKMLRIIQSIPSRKAEPFKRWLAQVGYERLQEIKNPALAEQRAELYRAKGYSDKWIDKRLRSVAIREQLTSEWKQRGITDNKDFGRLTAVMSKSTFDMTPKEHKAYKRLERGNLRDHMTDLELVFTMLGEASTTEISRKDDAQGFDENESAAYAGGTIAGNARRQLEKKTGKKVASRKNFLPDRRQFGLPSPD